MTEYMYTTVTSKQPAEENQISRREEERQIFYLNQCHNKLLIRIPVVSACFLMGYNTVVFDILISTQSLLRCYFSTWYRSM